MEKKLIINKKAVNSDDEYKIFSIRIKNGITKKLDDISKETNRSRNELINILLEFAINNCEIK